jgi:hypothetical protein
MLYHTRYNAPKIDKWCTLKNPTFDSEENLNGEAEYFYMHCGVARCGYLQWNKTTEYIHIVYNNDMHLQIDV